MYNLPALELPGDEGLGGTIFAGKLHFSSSTDSTNTDALAAARAGAPHGSVYFADEQLAGRGRGTHAWHSAAGEGLYVSVLFRPQFPLERLSLLPFAAGLAAAQAVRAAAGLNIDLRWPNDLLIGPRKVGGILVESKIQSKTLPHAVLGIGINVHQRAFPPGLSTAATSLDLEAGRRTARQKLLVALLKSLEYQTLALAGDSAHEIPERVAQSSSWISGRLVEVHGPQACSGITAGLDPSGFLLVKTAVGLVTIQTGGIRALNPGSAPQAQ